MENWRKLTGYGVKGFSGKKTELDKGQGNQFALLTERIEKGGESLIPFESIVNTTRASFACIQSLKERKWIDVE